MLNNHGRQLTATWLNIVAAGIVSAGTAGQGAALASGASASTCLSVGLGCLGLGIVVHAAAQLCAWSAGRSLRGGGGEEERSDTGGGEAGQSRSRSA